MDVSNDDINDEFFLKKIVDPSWKLVKNEYKLVWVILYTIIMVLFVMDILAIVYYY